MSEREMEEFWEKAMGGCPIRTCDNCCTAQPDTDEVTRIPFTPNFGPCDDYDCPFLFWLDRFKVMLIKEGT